MRVGKISTLNILSHANNLPRVHHLSLPIVDMESTSLTLPITNLLRIVSPPHRTNPLVSRVVIEHRVRGHRLRQICRRLFSMILGCDEIYGRVEQKTKTRKGYQRYQRLKRMREIGGEISVEQCMEISELRGKFADNGPVNRFCRG